MHSYDEEKKKAGKREVTISKSQTLNFRFHNANTQEAAVHYIVKILVKANQEKIGQVIEKEISKYMDMQNKKREEML